MKNAIEFIDFNKSYSDFSIRNANINVPKGFITGFIGPNGSGKTTLIKSIMGLNKADSGQILVDGKEIIFGGTNNQKIAFVTDDNYLSKDWTAAEIKQVFSCFFTSWDNNTFDQYLKKFNLSKDKKVKEFSKGMQMKLMISIALSYDSDILVLDEPTSGLDPASRYEIMDLLQEYIEKEERTVLFSTHITSDLEQVADYIIFIVDGDIIYNGTKDDLMETYMLAKGGNDDFSLIEKNIIGVKVNQTYFEGIIHKDHLIHDDSLSYEPLSLDQLIVYFYRESK